MKNEIKSPERIISWCCIEFARQRTDRFERITRVNILEIENVTREALLRRWLRSRAGMWS